MTDKEVKVLHTDEIADDEFWQTFASIDAHSLMEAAAQAADYLGEERATELDEIAKKVMVTVADYDEVSTNIAFLYTLETLAINLMLTMTALVLGHRADEPKEED